MINFKNQSFLMLIIMMSIIFFNSCEKKTLTEENRLGIVSEKKFHPFDTSDEIPDHIKSLENVSIFADGIDALYSVMLIEEWRIGDTKEPYLSNISDAVVDDQGGITVRSSNANYEQQLYVFDSDGDFRFKLGRQGKGPGEYGIILGMYSKANTIFVLDYTSQRLNEYSALDYTFKRSILFEEWKAPVDFKFGYVEPRYDGNYHVTFSNLRSKTGSLKIIQTVKDSEGKEVGFEPLVFPAGYRISTDAGRSKLPIPTMPLSFLGSTVTGLSQKDELFTSCSHEFLINKYDSTGKYQFSIYYPILGVPFILKDYSESTLFSPKVDEIEKALLANQIEMPDRLPVIDRLIIDDDNRIWVKLPTSSSRENYEWWILRENGELLAKLVLPREEPIYEIKKGYLYSKKTDEETGTEYLVKYKIKFTER